MKGFCTLEEDRRGCLDFLNIPKVKLWRQKALVEEGGAVQIVLQSKTKQSLFRKCAKAVQG